MRESMFAWAGAGCSKTENLANAPPRYRREENDDVCNSRAQSDAPENPAGGQRRKAKFHLGRWLHHLVVPNSSLRKSGVSGYHMTTSA